jgi:UDP-N-acetylmuramyl pentapeptide synthase
MPDEATHLFADSTEASGALKGMITTGDLVLIKGSQSMRMERIVEGLMANAALKEQQLVRQEEAWKRK